MTETASEIGKSNTSAVGMLAFEPRVSMVSYRVADIERSLRFYVGVLGMTEQFRGLGLGEGERELIVGYSGKQGASVMLMWNAERPRSYDVGTGYNRFTIIVKDAHRAMKHLEERGTPVAIPVTEANNVLFAVVKDPDGYMIELLQLNRG